MIVDPDFFDHWKTQMLVDLSKDDSAPLWILRLWSHAQQRRTGTLNLPPTALKAITKSRHRAEQTSDWLVEAGFIDRDGLKIVLHQWEEYNSGLFSAWENGKKGGRPPKKKDNQNESEDEPEPNPNETHGLPTGNPRQTQSKPIRGEESREDKKERESQVNPAPSLPFDSESFSITWKEWIDHLKFKEVSLSPATLRSVFGELKSWGEERSIKAIKFSIFKGGKFIFEETQYNSNQKPKAPEKIVKSLEEQRRDDDELAKKAIDEFKRKKELNAAH